MERQTGWIDVDLERADAGRDVDHAIGLELRQRLVQQMHAQAIDEIEAMLAVFEQQVFVAAAAQAQARMVVMRFAPRQYRIAGITAVGPTADARAAMVCANQAGDLPLTMRRLGRGQAHELHGVARTELAELPAFRRHGHRRADETAAARTIGSEQDRHVAGEIDRADGIGVVVQIRRMQARLAAIAARPERLGADQAHAGAVAVVVHRVARGVNFTHACGSEKVWRRMRPFEHADLPIADIARLTFAGQWRRTGGKFLRPTWAPEW